MQKRVLSALCFLTACGASALPQTSPVEEPNPCPSVQRPRLRPALQDAWWLPATQPSGTYPDAYVASVYGPVERYAEAAPLSRTPHVDTERGDALCWFYKVSGGEYRCLPGWVQRTAPKFTLDGFYADNPDRKTPCLDYADWRYAIPVTNAQRYLVLFDPESEDGVRVYEAVPSEVPVSFGRYEPTQGITSCTQAPNTYRYYKRGPEVAASLFAQL